MVTTAQTCWDGRSRQAIVMPMTGRSPVAMSTRVPAGGTTATDFAMIWLLVASMSRKLMYPRAVRLAVFHAL